MPLRSRSAGLIYDKLVGVVEALNAVGAKRGETKSAFDTALNRLSKGQGNALSQVKRLETMGVKGKKTMPAIRMGGEDVEALAEEAGELPAPALETEQSE
jgi:DNA anti-recombination protein RmuC